MAAVQRSGALIEALARRLGRRFRWLVVLVSLTLILIGLGANYLVVVGLKPIALDFGWSRASLALAYSLGMVGMGLGGIVMGFWSDRVGMGLPALVGAAMTGLGAVVAGLSHSLWLFYLAHALLIGMLGNGALFSPLVANTTRWFAHRRGLALGLVISGQSLAGAVWPPIFRYAIDQVGWRQTFIGYGLFAVCAMVPLSLLLRPRPPEPSRATALPAGGRGLIAGYRPNLVQAMLCLAIVGCCVPMAMPMVHIVAHASDLGFSAARGAEMLSLLLASSALSRLAFGWSADRLGGLRTLLVASTCQVSILALFTVVDSLAGLYLVSALFGVGLGGIIPAYAMIVGELFPMREAGWRVATIYFFATLGMGLGAWLAGFLFDLMGGYQVAFVTGIAFNLVNLALVTTLFARTPRPRPALA